MSDSLRDQLLKAGFSQPKPKPKSKPKSNARKKSVGQTNAQSKAKAATGGSALTGSSTGGATQNEPKAGHTHVPAVPAKKKKAKKAPAIKPRAGTWSTRSVTANAHTQTPADPEAAAKRRAMKVEVQALIESSALKEFKGEVIYRFTLQNKIRELQVSEDVRKRLADGELAITRLNGATRIVTAEAVKDIRNINPQWLVFLTTDADDSHDDDEEFPIPDDLIW